MAGEFGGVAGWLIRKMRKGRAAQARLTLLDRIALAPRQTLALVEAEGRRILVATSAEGGPVFYPLDENTGAEGRSPMSMCNAPRGSVRRTRISW
jgi:hypothetical protein